ncbi:hypothetical protein VTL71DRAFT_1177 [Oculimacula yallundae]|uniref:Uncharacterized protein n=1 Tax=Oculimacula yallundae TaxID=86028 RepID=A0ABR4D4H5_9HELO
MQYSQYNPDSLLDTVCSAAKDVRICPSSVQVEVVAPLTLPVAVVCAANQDTCVRECGGSNGNPCTVPGQVPCIGINICCPLNNLCYYDSSNVARCSPLSPSPLPPSTTTSSTSKSSTAPNPSPFTTTSTQPVTTTTNTPTTTTRLPTTTPTTTPYPNPSPPSSVTLSSNSSTFWTPAATGGVTGGAIGGIIILIMSICLCIRRRRSHPKPIADPHLSHLPIAKST